MKTSTQNKLRIVLATVLAFTGASTNADTFGSGVNTFTIDFVNIGNSGNGDDAGAGGGIYSSPSGGVAYDYRVGVYEISTDQINQATDSGLYNVIANAWTGSQPAAGISWYGAAAFVNWLNTSTGHQPAYNLTPKNNLGGWNMQLWATEDAWRNDPGAGADINQYRHKDAYYFLPSEDEWYKAAFHQNDGVTPNYWDYATGSNNVPDGIDFNGDPAFDAVFCDGFLESGPHAVTNVGIPSSYGTRGQDGNIAEWMESAFDGLNDSSSENRAFRSNSASGGEDGMRSSFRGIGDPTRESSRAGFRVASVPEPTSGPLVLGSGWIYLLNRRRKERL